MGWAPVLTLPLLALLGPVGVDVLPREVVTGLVDEGDPIVPSAVDTVMAGIVAKTSVDEDVDTPADDELLVLLAVVNEGGNSWH